MKFGMHVVYMRVAGGMLSLYELIDHAGLQGPGPKQRQDSDEIIEAIRPQSLYEVSHPTRFELKHRGRLVGLQ